ncbi:hypothetical protein Cha6605_0314 [Chamaesiphon minutus PCC 6605]|uniref:Uncharacterized protein n=1 Tax=Chamaesiphon minutus (strain ATCC 27169 / PCC 6605) TaxID=1173020 RepID=K9UBL4_CHAP6|nr:hypothetical protein Cha6605_0314 [Chamaesiphon minutus PCC 6605]
MKTANPSIATYLLTIERGGGIVGAQFQSKIRNPQSAIQNPTHTTATKESAATRGVCGGSRNDSN